MGARDRGQSWQRRDFHGRRDDRDAVRMVADAAQVRRVGRDDRCAQPARLQVQGDDRKGRVAFAATLWPSARRNHRGTAAAEDARGNRDRAPERGAQEYSRATSAAAGRTTPGLAPAQRMARIIRRKRRQLGSLSTLDSPLALHQQSLIMKKLAFTAILATMMLAPFGISDADGNRASDAPEFCQKKQGCCPSASCCSGGQHTMGAQCMLHAARSRSRFAWRCIVASNTRQYRIYLNIT